MQNAPVDSRELVANILISRGCVQISPKSPFTYASGLVGPIYCDNRRLLSFVEDREIVVKEFCEKIISSNVEFKQIAGLATAGIPHAAFIAQKISRPMIYIRSSAKKHGKGNLVEGAYEKGDLTIVIEDLVNQAKSLEEAVVGGRECGLEINSCFSIVDYEMEKAKERLKAMGVTLYSLTDFSTLVKVAVEKKLIDESGRSSLMRWHDAPSVWK